MTFVFEMTDYDEECSEWQEIECNEFDIMAIAREMLFEMEMTKIEVFNEYEERIFRISRLKNTPYRVNTHWFTHHSGVKRDSGEKWLHIREWVTDDINRQK